MDNIVIIGGGAAAAAVFGETLQRVRGQTLHWVAGHEGSGRGVAYATDDERHVLNVRAAGMSLFSDQDQAFVEHASRQRAAVQATDFLPRRMFGDFIEAQVAACMARAQVRGHRFEVHRDEAVRVERSADRSFRVTLWHGATIEAHSVVLAVGALPPRPLRVVSQPTLESGRYVLDPWRRDDTGEAPRRVMVIGTGLTAVDTLLSAATRWPQAELVAVSRHGRLPLRHAPLPQAPYAYQSDLNAELERSEGLRSMLRAVRRVMAESPDVDGCSVIDGMRAVNARLWARLSLDQRRQFLRHLRWLWEAARHRMAPASADAIQALRDCGRLNVHAARVLEVTGERCLQVRVRHRATQVEEILNADRVVQATGLDTTAAYTGHTLASQLIEDGLVRPDPLRLGVAAMADGRLIGANGRVTDGLYAIGALLRGALWECTAMPEIRLAAQDLAGIMAERAAVYRNAIEHPCR